MKKRESVIRKTCTFIILLMLAFSMGAFPLLSFNTAAEESHSFVRIWVDKGCGESYKSGERIKISFKVESFEPEAPVTIIWNIPGKEPEYVVLVQSYPTNEENSLVEFAKCPGGKHKLEIFVTSPSVESPPEEVPPAYFSRKVDIDLDSECIFYIDPGSEECGDNIDNDCDGKVDEDCLIPIVDHDGDGYYLPADCNDDDPNIHPGAGEVCDGKDNNCNGRIDEDCYICFSDHDGDGYTLCYDCNDYDRTVHPRAAEFCDGKDNDCDGVIDEDCIVCSTDIDGDGYTNCEDCNDYDSSVYPRAYEACDEKDNDCDGVIDEDCPSCLVDHDGDGFASCTDCDDNNSYVYPGAPEFCDRKDNDCDGLTDEGLDCGFVDIWVAKGCGADYRVGDNVGIFFKVHSSALSAKVTVTYFTPRGEPGVLISGSVYESNMVHRVDTLATCPEGLVILIIVVKVTLEGKMVILFDYCAFYVVDCRILDSDDDGHNSIQRGGDDCDDYDSDVHPGAEEVCDRKDNDCDGLIDEGGDCEYVEIWVEKKCGEYYDDEEPIEVYFRVNSSVSSARVSIVHFALKGEPATLASNRTFRTNEVFHFPLFALCPAGMHTLVITVEVVIEGRKVVVTDDCFYYVRNCRPLDNDGDGYISIPKGGDDCDDNDPGVHPGAEEVCDGKDNNCDGLVDEGLDNDGDGYTECRDCDDTDPSIHPGAEEVCDDNINNDCDDEVDETADKDKDGHNAIECGGDDCDDTDPSIYPGAEEVCDGKDNNCDGAIDEGFDEDNDGYRSAECGGDDCDDTDPAVHPGAEEVCDGKDNNCDGVIDEGFDEDGDGYTTCENDCDDTDPAVHPGAEEVCDDSIDNDCDEEVDETADKDKDGHKSIECGGDDCDDTDPNVHPGAEEICDDNIDNNCNGQVDEGSDEDNDGYTTCENDCDDTNPNVHPGAEEICDDNIDNNCNGQVDEGSDEDNDGYKSDECGGNDCDDTNPSIHPGAEEICDDNIDNDCDEEVDETADKDNDGYKSDECGGNDCDDKNRRIYPGAEEICDGRDNDCDGTTDENLEPSKPILISPGDEEIFSDKERIPFEWDKQEEESIRYIVQFSEDSSFSSIYEERSRRTTSMELKFEGGQYYWRVKAVLDCGESEWSETRNFSVVGVEVLINDDDETTSSVEVTLTIESEFAVEMKIVNDNERWEDAEWIPYRENVEWTLYPKEGKREVRVRVRDETGVESTGTDSINLELTLEDLILAFKKENEDYETVIIRLTNIDLTEYSREFVVVRYFEKGYEDPCSQIMWEDWGDISFPQHCLDTCYTGILIIDAKHREVVGSGEDKIRKPLISCGGYYFLQVKEDYLCREINETRVVQEAVIRAFLTYEITKAISEQKQTLISKNKEFFDTVKAAADDDTSWKIIMLDILSLISYSSLDEEKERFQDRLRAIIFNMNDAEFYVSEYEKVFVALMSEAQGYTEDLDDYEFERTYEESSKAIEKAYIISKEKERNLNRLLREIGDMGDESILSTDVRNAIQDVLDSSKAIWGSLKGNEYWRIMMEKFQKTLANTGTKILKSHFAAILEDIFGEEISSIVEDTLLKEDSAMLISDLTIEKALQENPKSPYFSIQNAKAAVYIAEDFDQALLYLANTYSEREEITDDESEMLNMLILSQPYLVVYTKANAACALRHNAIFQFFARPLAGLSKLALLESKYPGNQLLENAKNTREKGKEDWQLDFWKFMKKNRDRTESFNASIESPADIHIYDSQGRHVGIDYRTGEIEKEIPNAIYLENDHIAKIIIPFPSDEYKVEVVGTGSGEYGLTITQPASLERTDEPVSVKVTVPITGNTSKGRTQTFAYDANQVASQISQEMTKIMQERGLTDPDEYTRQDIMDEAVQKIVETFDSDGDGTPDIEDTDPVPSRVDWGVYVVMYFRFFLLGILGISVIILSMVGFLYVRKRRSSEVEISPIERNGDLSRHERKREFLNDLAKEFEEKEK